MISFSEFDENLKNLKLDNNSNIYIKLLNFYNLYQNGGYCDFGDIDSILEDLFCIYKKSNDFYIPISFINSAIGQVLFTLKFKIDTKVSFRISDICNMLNCTRSLISKDIKSGKLRTNANNGHYIIEKNDLINYMQLKGLSLLDANKLIKIYLKEKNL